jgi:drug/metabolite transporter (DMT)-like permease
VIPARVFHDYALVRNTWAGALLAFVGAVITLRQVRRWLARQNDNHAAVALAVVGAVVSAPAFATPLDWGRYYLLPVFFFGFSTVVGADWVARRAWGALRAARARL